MLVSGNKQDIFNLGKNSAPISMIKNLQGGNSIKHPSGICVGRLGELYITDQSNHSIFWVYEGVASTVYSTPSDIKMEISLLVSLQFLLQFG